MKRKLFTETMMIKKCILRCLLVFGIFITCGKQNQIDYFAKVNDDYITVDEFSKRLKFFTRVTGIKDNLQTRETLLDQMINERLLIQNFHEKKLDQAQEFKLKVKSIQTQIYLNAFYRKVFLDSVTVSEKEVNQRFSLYNQKIAARHLYARTKEEADELYQRLQQGESFEALARVTFQDSTLANNGGYLGYFSKGEMDPAFEKVAFSMKVGEISTPVKTRYGYSIIKVENRFQKPLVSESEFIKAHPGLIEEIIKEKSKIYAQQYGNRIAQRMNPTFNERMVQFIFAKISSADKDNQIVTDIDMVFNEKIFHQIREDNLVSFKGGKWSVGTFLEHAKLTSLRQQKRIQTHEDLKKFITGLIVREELIKQALKHGVNKDEKVRSEINHNIDGYIVNQMRKMIADTTSVPAEAIREAYEKMPQQQKSFEQARAQIENELLWKWQKIRLHNYISQLRSKADMKVLRDKLRWYVFD